MIPLQDWASQSRCGILAWAFGPGGSPKNIVSSIELQMSGCSLPKHATTINHRGHIDTQYQNNHLSADGADDAD